ncbi:MAG: hypothetical protein HY660_15765 [Armatimonadetes bacterium]|nr:hypothetical protein [Armatimonadota bacterium]
MVTHSKWLVLGMALVVGLSLLIGDSYAAPSAPQSGGTVAFGYLQRPRSLDPNVWTGTTDNFIIRQMYDPLLWSPKVGTYVPGLATAWEVSKDGKVYTFKLRRDVKFHDGTPLRADAVKLMFDRIADPTTKSLQGPAIGPYDRAQVVDDYTVRIYLKEPFAPLLANLAGTALSPGSPTAIRSLGDKFAQSPVATGPFKFEKWEGNDLHMVRNPDYKWASAFMNRQGPAYLEKIIWKTIPEAATRMIALQRGEVIGVGNPVLDQVAQFKKDQNFRVYRIDTPGHPKSMPINIKTAPTDDLRVRQAILYGVDRQKVVDLVQHGNADVAHSPFTRSSLFYNAAVKGLYPYNKKKAVELLEAAGWMGKEGVRQKGGQKLKLAIIMFGVGGPNQQLAEVVQAMLTELGFEVSLDVTGYDAYAKRVTEGTYNMAEINYTGLDPNVPAFLMFHSSQIMGGGQFNRTRVADPKLDNLIDTGRRATDTKTRDSAYKEFQMNVMRNAYTLPIWDNSWVTIAGNKLQGLAFDPEGRWLFYNVWLRR